MSLSLGESTQEKVPPLLEDILKRTLFNEKCSELKQTDIFFILIIVLLSENGFILVANNSIELQCWQHIDNTHLSKWKTSTGVYELTFVMSGFNNTLIKLVYCGLETSSLINVVINDIKPEDVYSVCFPVSYYIVNMKALTIPMIFSHLKHLSDTFKDKVITPVKSTILNYYGYSGASLIGLPEEVIFSILLNLPMFDIINVAITCKKLNLLINKSESFWHRLFLRDFPNKYCQVKIDMIGNSEWKTSYRMFYSEHLDELRASRSRLSVLNCFHYNPWEWFSDNFG